MSLELIKEITLDVQSLQNTPQFNIKSGNNLSNVILITLQNNGQEINLQGLTCRYCILRADYTQNLSDAVIEDNKVKIILSENDLKSPGRMSCELILSENEKVVFSSTFYIMILANVLDEQKVKNSDEYGSIFNVLDKTDGLADSIISLQNEVSNNEDLRQTRENIRQENENIRQENELQRQTSFIQIQTRSNEIIEESEENSQYAKEQGDYAKEQADRIADSDMSSLQTQIEQLDIEVDDLKGYVGYTDDDIFGVEVDFKNNRFTRLAGAKNLTEGADFNIINAYNRRRCILNDNGEVIAYYGDSGYIEDGSKGQVMVEQPKFYYKVVPLELEPINNSKGYLLRKARYYICDTQKYGFKLHPAFIQNGAQKDKIYLSAYEGSIYDTSESTYLFNDEQVADFNTDKLCSIANAKPCSGTSQKLTRANSRKLANNRGNGWELSTIQSVSATQLLFLIEYASFNMQDKIGIGITNKSTGTTNESENTGLTSVLGNNTGVGENNAVSYRGEENIYGNIWCYVDGINPYSYGKGYIYIADYNFSDSTYDSNYNDSGLIISSKSGYISTFGYNEKYDWLFIPSECIGNSSLPIGDYTSTYNTASFQTVASIGGYYASNEQAGLFCWSLIVPTTVSSYSYGSRLVYIK